MSNSRRKKRVSSDDSAVEASNAMRAYSGDDPDFEEKKGNGIVCITVTPMILAASFWRSVGVLYRT